MFLPLGMAEEEKGETSEHLVKRPSIKAGAAASPFRTMAAVRLQQQDRRRCLFLYNSKFFYRTINRSVLRLILQLDHSNRIPR